MREASLDLTPLSSQEEPLHLGRFMCDALTVESGYSGNTPL